LLFLPGAAYDGAVSGRLFLVGTPIGNLEDITLRALRVLREADLVAAEDTRHTGRLLAHYQIRKPLLSYHEFNEAQRAAELVERLRGGQTIALVSDAGMPAISDPGMRLVRAACSAAIPVETVPGPSAVTMSVALAGMQSGRFLFYGFLPARSAQRKKALIQLAPLPYALVFFESPFRLVAALRDMEETLGNRTAMIARELTKKFEEVLRGKVRELREKLEPRRVKGEITIVMEGAND
jgi:16S rRNA (cytidine1402-2'-O)-methyltransferase